LLVLVEEFMVEVQKDSAIVEPKKGDPDKIVNTDNSLKNSYSRCALILDEVRLRDILENIPSAVMVVEKPDVKVTYANESH
jgi:hypothetical protein